jgi:hypothetical protein
VRGKRIEAAALRSSGAPLVYNSAVSQPNHFLQGAAPAMKPSEFPSLLVTIVVLVLAVVAVLFGFGMMPTAAEATERGVYVPWLLVWGMIAIVEVCALLMAGLMLAARAKSAPGARV